MVNQTPAADAPVVSVRIKPPQSPSTPTTTIVQSAPAESTASAPATAQHQGHHGLGERGTSMQPCLFSGLSSGFSAAVLGFFFGAFPSMLRNRKLSLASTWGMDGLKSAQALALVSGLYTWIQCLCSRIRQKDDGINRGVAGCATGLLMGWQGGPVGMAQSCAGLGLISYVVDLGGAADTPAAKAAALVGLGPACGGAGCTATDATSTPQHTQQQQQVKWGQQQRREGRRQVGSAPAWLRAAGGVVGGAAAAPLAQLQALPPVMWLGAVMQPAYFS